MRESQIEARFRFLVRAAGGMTEKLAPTHKGIPDRLVIMPGGRVYLVELKALGGRLSPAQQVWHQRARALGVNVVVLTGLDEVKAWIVQVTETGELL